MAIFLHYIAHGGVAQKSRQSGENRDIFLTVLGGLPPTMEATSRGAIFLRRIFDMSKFVAWLRSLGPAGTLAANLLVFITTNWVTVMSLVTGLVVAIRASAVSFFQEPAVQVGISIFLITLWTIVGVLYVYDRTKPRTMRVVPDYRYGLTFEGLNPFLDAMDEAVWLSFGIAIRNYSQAPIRYAIEEFDIRIGSRALPKPEKIFTGYLPRGGGKSISPSKFRKDDVREFFGKRVKGTADISISYGHPEEKPVRRLRLHLEITLHFAETGEPPFAWGADIQKEEDEPFDPNNR